MSHGTRAGKHQIPPGNATGRPVEEAALSPKARGRTAKTTKPDATAGPNATEGHVLQERLTEVNNPIGRGGGKMRGDRQHTTPDPGMRGKSRKTGTRGNGVNSNLRTDRNPTSTAGRRNNSVKNEGG